MSNDNNSNTKVAPLGLKDRLRDATPEERREILDGLQHEVGFGKPPKAGQFQKGSSGNPKGRPKGTPNLRTILADEMANPIVVNEGGRRRKMSAGQVIVRRCVQQAAGGDLRAMAAVSEMARRAGMYDEKNAPAEQVFTPDDLKVANALLEAFNAVGDADEH
jgi:hypothetical protein